MINKKDKNQERLARHKRIRNKISGSGERPRLSVYRSLSNLKVQIIDDEKGITLASSSTLSKEISGKLGGLTKTEQAKLIGKDIAEKAIKLKIKEIVFDRGGYLYTGRVKALAESAREAGLKF
ncbi:MAG: 50S ribosomal protein L18 [Clostridia bacterium]|jgi:large subunit ribosomal protein L18|nr:50S ribosomal protein L18 [Clostridia bacterium]